MNPEVGELLTRFKYFDDNIIDWNLRVVNIVGKNIETHFIRNTNIAEITFEGSAGIYLMNVFNSDGEGRILKVIKY